MATLVGEDALVAASSLVFQKLRADWRFSEFIVLADFSELAAHVRRFLQGAFGGDEWPELRVNEEILRGYDDLADALVDALNQPMPLGADIMSAAFNLLATDMADDERVLLFLERVEEAAMVAVDNKSESVDSNNKRASGTAVDEEVNLVDFESPEEIQNTASATAEAVLQDINVQSFEELHLLQTQINAAQDGWRLFLSTSASQEAAGEAIYSALFEGAPSLQSLFTSPRAVQAMRFMNGLSSFVLALSDPPKLKILVETLGFGHLHLDVTIPRVIIFRDAILDLFSVELGERFSQQALDGWRTLLNYVGGAIIFVKTHYAERIRLILASWQIANAKTTPDSTSNEGSSDKSAAKGGSGDKTTSRIQKFAVLRYKKSVKTTTEPDAVTGQAGHAQLGDDKALASGVPTTYPEMFAFNSAVMGFNDRKWMKEVLDCFHNITVNVANSARLQEECAILALRISRVSKGTVNFNDYKSCMLATLRAILPKDWSTSHEVAWSWLWENVERTLMKTMGKPPKWQESLSKFYAVLTDETKFEMRADIYARFFVSAPAGQDYFKQSNAYLHIIAEKIMDMTLDIYVDPVKMVDDISALGLRHVGYGIPTEFFGPFVSACVEMLNTYTQDESVIDAFRWSLGLVSQMLVRTIQEGSTIVMKAITSNNSKQLRKAISCAPRGERASWVLLVQVGSQDKQVKTHTDTQTRFWSSLVEVCDASRLSTCDVHNFDCASPVRTRACVCCVSVCLCVRVCVRACVSVFVSHDSCCRSDLGPD